MENPFYKHKCIPNNTEYYIKLYIGYYPDLKEKLKNSNIDERYHYDIWRNDMKIQVELFTTRYEQMRAEYDEIRRKAAEKRNENNKITSDGYFRGIKFCGKVQVVKHFPDFKVQVVEHFPN